MSIFKTNKKQKDEGINLNSKRFYFRVEKSESISLTSPKQIKSYTNIGTQKKFIRFKTF